MQASFSFFTFICSTESSIAKGTAVKSVNFDLEIFEAFFLFIKDFVKKMDNFTIWCQRIFSANDNRTEYMYRN